jgi:hypothetical protein
VHRTAHPVVQTALLRRAAEAASLGREGPQPLESMPHTVRPSALASARQALVALPDDIGKAWLLLHTVASILFPRLRAGATSVPNQDPLVSLGEWVLIRHGCCTCSMAAQCKGLTGLVFTDLRHAMYTQQSPSEAASAPSPAAPARAPRGAEIPRRWRPGQVRLTTLPKAN